MIAGITITIEVTSMNSPSMVSPEHGPLLTIEETMAVLHKASTTLAHWRCAGTGPAYVRVGRTIFYPRHEIDKYLRSNTIRPSVAA